MQVPHGEHLNLGSGISIWSKESPAYFPFFHAAIAASSLK
jgi:hypothetical protein